MYTFLYCFHFHVSQLSPSSGELNQHEVNSAQHMQSGSQVWTVCAAKWILSQSYLVQVLKISSCASHIFLYSFQPWTSSTWKQVVPHAFPRFSQPSANIVGIYLFSFLSNNTATTLPQLKHHIPIAHLKCRYVLYRLAETVFLSNGLPARLSMRITAQILHANDFKA